MLRKIIVFLICFIFITEQAGFAQVVPAPVPAYLSGLSVPDRFRPVHLRSLSCAPAGSVDLLIDKGDAPAVKPVVIEQTARQLFDYFLIGLSLPNQSFWVNLRPDGEKDMIDPLVEKTDLGKVLLEADLQLKKDMALCTSPKTPEGRQYWDQLYAKAQTLYGAADVSIPALTRPWIVPGEIIIGENAESAYIYKATLKVMLEQDYLKGSVQYSFDDERLKILNDYSSELLRKLVIPKLTRMVNGSKQYASFRQVYYSLILAQWFKQKFKIAQNTYSRRIDSQDLSGLTSKKAWNKNTYFEAYQKSFKNGEYNLSETVYDGFGQTIRQYISGGIALRQSMADGGRTPGSVIQTEPGILPGAEGPFLVQAAVSSEGAVRVMSPVAANEETSAVQDVVRQNSWMGIVRQLEKGSQWFRNAMHTAINYCIALGIEIRSEPILLGSLILKNAEGENLKIISAIAKKYPLQFWNYARSLGLSDIIAGFLPDLAPEDIMRNKPLAIIVYPVDDYNGAFNDLRIHQLSLILAGFEVRTVRVRTVDELIAFVNTTSPDKNLAVLIIGGHGSPYAMQFSGERVDVPFLYAENLQFNSLNFFFPHFREELEEWSHSLATWWLGEENIAQFEEQSRDLIKEGRRILRDYPDIEDAEKIENFFQLLEGHLNGNLLYLMREYVTVTKDTSLSLNNVDRLGAIARISNKNLNLILFGCETGRNASVWGPLLSLARKLSEKIDPSGTVQAPRFVSSFNRLTLNAHPDHQKGEKYIGNIQYTAFVREQPFTDTYKKIENSLLMNIFNGQAEHGGAERVNPAGKRHVERSLIKYFKIDPDRLRGTSREAKELQNFISRLALKVIQAHIQGENSVILFNWNKEDEQLITYAKQNGLNLDAVSLVKIGSGWENASETLVEKATPDWLADHLRSFQRDGGQAADTYQLSPAQLDLAWGLGIDDARVHEDSPDGERVRDFLARLEKKLVDAQQRSGGMSPPQVTFDRENSEEDRYLVDFADSLGINLPERANSLVPLVMGGVGAVRSQWETQDGGIAKKAKNTFEQVRRSISDRVKDIVTNKKKEYTLTSYLQEHKEIPASIIVALETHLDSPLDLTSRFSVGLLMKTRPLVAYWSHNIANFISRQFSDYRRGIVELVSNGLDATEGRVKVVVKQGVVLVSNGGKGVRMEEILTSFLIPTLSSKIIGKGIGRFGVGFLSSFNYLDTEDDSLEIFSFDESGKGFRIVFGVRVEGEGKSKRKIIMIRSVEEGLSLEDTLASQPELFSGIEDVRTGGGTVIRINSERLDAEEVSKLEMVLNDAFRYWMGTPLHVEIVKRLSAIGFDKENYFEAAGETTSQPEKRGKAFSLYSFSRNPGERAVRRAHTPGSGRVMVTLQGVLLAAIPVLGSNSANEVVVNLPSSTRIPTSRDKIIPDRKTFEALLDAAESIRNDADLSVEDKMALINSLFYVWEWLKTKSPSVAAECEALHPNGFEGAINGIIADQKKISAQGGRTIIFVPDTFQAHDFFAGTADVILVNPRLLQKIEFIGQSANAVRTTDPRLKHLTVFTVKTNADIAAVRLGNVVMIKEGEAVDTSEAVWQNVLVAVAIHYWEFMMGQLGQLTTSGFEAQGRFGGIDEDAARKDLVMQFLNKKIGEIEKKLAEDKQEYPHLKLSNTGLKKELALLLRVREIVEQSERGGVFYFIFQDMIQRDALSFSQATFDIDGFKSTNDWVVESGSTLKKSDLLNDFALRSAGDIVTAPGSTQTFFNPVQLVIDLQGARTDLMPLLPDQNELSDEENNFIFAVAVISQWISLDERADKLIKGLSGTEEGRSVLKQILSDISSYRNHKRANREPADEGLDVLFDFLDYKYIRVADVGNAETGNSFIMIPRQAKRILTTNLSNIVSTFFRRASDIRVSDVSEAPVSGLRLRAGLGQIQQSVNYQDTEWMVFIRELVQNSLDAIAEENGKIINRILRILFGERTSGIEMSTRTVLDEDGVPRVEFKFRDEVGMSLGRLLNYLLIPNRSSKIDVEVLTGFFGHGFLTVLKDAEKVLVKTATGNGRVYYLLLTPTLDEEEGVVLDVGWELYQSRERFKGTEISWRKRGPASPVDEALIRMRAEMFTHTLDAPGVSVQLNGLPVAVIDRNRAHLSLFRNSSGQTCRVLLDENHPSLVIQRGLLVSRLDRNFIEYALGVKGEMLELLMKLSRLGIVLELPSEILLTRDRAHFLQEDLTMDMKKLILSALFDAAVRAIAAEKIDKPASFSYEFFQDTQRITGAKNLDIMLDAALLSNHFSPRELMVMVLCWVLYNDENGDAVTLQDFLIETQKFAKEQQRRFREIGEELLTSQEYLEFLESLTVQGLDSFTVYLRQLLAEKGIPAAESEEHIDAFIKACREALPDGRLNKTYIDRSITQMMSNLQDSAVSRVVHRRLEGKVARPSSVPSAYALRAQGLTVPDTFVPVPPSYITISFNGEEIRVPVFPSTAPETRAVLQSAVSLARSMLFGLFDLMDGSFRDIVSDFEKLSGVIQQAIESRREKDTGAVPEIEKLIIDFISSQINEAFRVDIEDIVAAQERAIQEGADDLKEEVWASIYRSPLNGFGIDLEDSRKIRSDVPQLYFFLKISLLLIRMITGNELLEETGLAAHYDVSSHSPHIAFAEKFTGISWNLAHAEFLVRSLMRYLRNQDENSLNDFLSRMTDVLTHEETHMEEERAAGTHNKAFFDHQLALLGALLRDPRSIEQVKVILHELAEEYNSLPNEIKQQIDAYLADPNFHLPTAITTAIERKKQSERDETSGLLKIYPDGGTAHDKSVRIGNVEVSESRARIVEADLVRALGLDGGQVNTPEGKEFLRHLAIKIIAAQIRSQGEEIPQVVFTDTADDHALLEFALKEGVDLKAKAGSLGQVGMGSVGFADQPWMTASDGGDESEASKEKGEHAAMDGGKFLTLAEKIDLLKNIIGEEVSLWHENNRKTIRQFFTPGQEQVLQELVASWHLKEWNERYPIERRIVTIQHEGRAVDVELLVLPDEVLYVYTRISGEPRDALTGFQHNLIVTSKKIVSSFDRGEPFAIRLIEHEYAHVLSRQQNPTLRGGEVSYAIVDPDQIILDEWVAYLSTDISHSRDIFALPDQFIGYLILKTSSVVNSYVNNVLYGNEREQEQVRLKNERMALLLYQYAQILTKQQMLILLEELRGVRSFERFEETMRQVATEKFSISQVVIRDLSRAIRNIDFRSLLKEKENEAHFYRASRYFERFTDQQREKERMRQGGFVIYAETNLDYEEISANYIVAAEKGLSIQHFKKEGNWLVPFFENERSIVREGNRIQELIVNGEENGIDWLDGGSEGLTESQYALVQKKIVQLGKLVDSLKESVQDPEITGLPLYDNFTGSLSGQWGVLIQENLEGGVPEHREEASIDSLVNEAVERLAEFAHTENIKIETTSTGFSFKANKSEQRALVESVGELLTNAIKYSRPAGEDKTEQKTIRVDVSRLDDGRIKILVIDQGIGLYDDQGNFRHDYWEQTETTILTMSEGRKRKDALSKGIYSGEWGRGIVKYFAREVLNNQGSDQQVLFAQENPEGGSILGFTVSPEITISYDADNIHEWRKWEILLSTLGRSARHDLKNLLIRIGGYGELVLTDIKNLGETKNAVIQKVEEILALCTETQDALNVNPVKPQEVGRYDGGTESVQRDGARLKTELEKANTRLGDPIGFQLVTERSTSVAEAIREEMTKRSKNVETLMEEFRESPVLYGGAAAEKGGIDLRALPITTRPFLNPGSMPLATVEGGESKDLNELWKFIEQEMKTGAVPYGKIKEYAGCCRQQNAQRRMRELFAYIANILRMEEERAVLTSPEMREIVAYMG